MKEQEIGHNFVCKKCGRMLSSFETRQHYKDCIESVLTHPSMNCPQCEKPLIDKGHETKTLLGFSSPEGHDHDDNCRKRTYECENRHVLTLSIINRCPACEWKGKMECWCAQKVEQWPNTRQ